MGCAAVAILCAGAFTDRFGSGLRGAPPAGFDWIERARATFDGASDGAGDGVTFPAESGRLAVLLRPGKALKEVGPTTGVTGGRLLLSDVGTAGDSAFGVRLVPTAEATGAAFVSLDFTSVCEWNRFSVRLTDVGDGATTECAAWGDLPAGATTQMVGLYVEGGSLRVNATTLKMRLAKQARFRVEIGLVSLVGRDVYEVAVANLETGEIERVTGDLAGGFKPLRGVDIIKHTGHADDLYIDNLSILAPAK